MTGSTHRFGLAWTPRFQAMVESFHKAVSAFLTIWLRALVKEFPQRWHNLLRMAFYQVQHTPITESGLTPFALRCGWFAATPLERCLHPWDEVPAQLCLQPDRLANFGFDLQRNNREMRVVSSTVWP